MQTTKDDQELSRLEKDFIGWIRTTGNLPKHLRTVHDLAIHHSTIPIDGELKDSLCFTAECSLWVEKLQAQQM